MKKILFVCCLLPHLIVAQDIIIKTNGEELQSKVIEIDADKIKYKKFDNPDGPIYTIIVPDVFMIKYANGTKDVLSSQEKKTPITEVVKFNITGTWTNKLISEDNIQIAKEGISYSITMKGKKAPLSPLNANEYTLEGSSIRAYAINNDSIYLKDIQNPVGPKLYLVRNIEPLISKPSNSKEGMFGISVSSGIGASYAGLGVNAALRLGSRSFSIQPNIGLGLFTYTLDGTTPISLGVKMYFDNFYIGYKYGYIGSAYVDYYSYTDFVDVDGSVLMFGSDWYLGKKKNWFLTSGIGINISGIDLEINESDFDLGFGVRF